MDGKTLTALWALMVAWDVALSGCSAGQGGWFGSGSSGVDSADSAVASLALDMVGVVGDPRRKTLQSGRARQPPSCAVCCYATAEYVRNTLTEVRINSETIEKFGIPDEGRAAETRCPDDLVQSKLEHGGDGSFYVEPIASLDDLIQRRFLNPGDRPFDADGFVGLILQLEMTCLGRPEYQCRAGTRSGGMPST